MTRLAGVVVSLLLASVATASEGNNEIGMQAEALFNFSWVGERSEREAEFSSLAYREVERLIDAGQAAELLEGTNLSPQARLPLAEAILKRFGNDLGPDATRAQEDRRNIPWLCIALSEFVAASDDTRAELFYDRLLAVDVLKTISPSTKDVRLLNSLYAGLCIGVAGEKADPALLRAIQSKDLKLRWRAERLIVLMQPSTLSDELATLLTDTDPQTREFAALSVEMFQTQNAIESLRGALADESDPVLRNTMQQALWRCEHPSEDISDLETSGKLAGVPRNWIIKARTPIRKLDPQELEVLLKKIEVGTDSYEGNEAILLVSSTEATLPRFEAAFRKMCKNRFNLNPHDVIMRPFWFKTFIGELRRLKAKSSHGEPSHSSE